MDKNDLHYPTNVSNMLEVRNKEQQILNDIAQLLKTQPSFNASALADDAFTDPQSRMIYTTDILLENRHFSMAYFSPYQLGWKSAAVNISDIAGMGGEFRYLMLALALPESIDSEWIRGFYEGSLSVCQRFQGQIIGGDTVGSDSIIISGTAIGQYPSHHSPGHRYQAKPGDIIVSSGYHGLSAIGLEVLQQGIEGFEICKKAHLRPIPRIEAGLALSGLYRRYALMDSSDGLADAALKMAQASGVTFVLDAAQIPIHPDLSIYLGTNSPWDTILYGGEDFELVATIPEWHPALTTYFKPIGHVEACTDNKPEAFLQINNARIPLSLEKTYQHFNMTETDPVDSALIDVPQDQEDIPPDLEAVLSPLAAGNFQAFHHNWNGYHWVDMDEATLLTEED